MITRYFISIVLHALLCTAATAATYFVSPAGNNENAGTSAAAPWGMVQDAVDRMSAGDTLVVLDGVYTGMLTLKSGISITARNPRRVIFTEAKALSGSFEKHAENIYKIAVKKAPEQVFHKGQPMTWARWPNMNWSENWKPGKKWVTTVSLPGTTTCKEFAQLNGKDLGGGYIFLRYAKGNSCYSRAIETFEGTTLKWDDTNFYNRLFTGEDGKRGAPWIMKPGQKTRNVFFLAGALDLLDSEGEWFVKDKILYLYAAGGVAPSAADVLCQADDYSIYDAQPLSNVSISGIDFFATSLSLRNPGNRNISFTDCQFSYIGGELLFQDNIRGSRNDKPILVNGSGTVFTKCLFAGAQNTGLQIIGSEITVENCVFLENNRHANFQSMALQLSPSGTYKVTGCTFFNNCSDAIRVNNAKDFTRTTKPSLSYNNIFNAGMYNSDVSGVYFPNMTQHMTEFHHNWVHNVKGNGVRLDQAGEELSVHHNVFWSSKRGMSIEGYGKFNIYNNTSVRNKEACDMIRNVVAKSKGSNPAMVSNDTSFPPISDWNVINNLVMKFADSVGPSEDNPFDKAANEGTLNPYRAKRKSLPVRDRGSVQGNITGFKTDIFVNGHLGGLNLIPAKGMVRGGAKPTPALEAEGVTSLDSFRGAYDIADKGWRTGSDWLPYGLTAPDTMAQSEKLAKKYSFVSIVPAVELAGLATGKLSEQSYIKPVAKPAAKPASGRAKKKAKAGKK